MSLSVKRAWEPSFPLARVTIQMISMGFSATPGTMSYFGGSIHGLAMLIIPFSGIELRLLGFQLALSAEGGDFAAWRQDNPSINNLAPNPFLVSIGFFSEVPIRLCDSVLFGLRAGLGGCKSDWNGKDFPPNISAGAYLTIDALTAWFQVAGIMDTESPSVTAGAVYRLF
jgi:hypothetical protein